MVVMATDRTVTDAARATWQPEVLRDVSPATEVSPQIVWVLIVREVAQLHGVDVGTVLKRRRCKTSALARRHAWFRMREETAFSWPEIGTSSGFDHTTCMVGAKKFARECGLWDWRG